MIYILYYRACTIKQNKYIPLNKTKKDLLKKKKKKIEEESHHPHGE